MHAPRPVCANCRQECMKEGQSMRRSQRSPLRKAGAIAIVLITAIMCAVPWSSAATAAASLDETLGARPVITLDFARLLNGRNALTPQTETRVLMPGGCSVGVAIRTRGVLVVGMDEGAASDAGLRAGDVILSVNGLPLEKAEVLTSTVAAAEGQMVELVIDRDGRERTLMIAPRYDKAGAAWRLGVWVRDSTAGVGTLTFYDPQTLTYGALGHAITDTDTGSVLSVREGELMQAQIVDVRRGQRGTPGELRGSFLREQVQLGAVLKNTAYGIYGTLNAPVESALYPDGLPVASRSEVHAGTATILSTVDDGSVTEYTVEITQVLRQSGAAQKSLELKVTDERLLEKTGGIVQGMSGSPIIQDGKIVGAVTHVLVNDPTRGYGIFIENMLDAAA